MGVITSVLAGNATVSLLDAGRNLGARGIGLSASSRALTNKFLSESSGLADGLFQSSVGSVRSAQIAINALRSSRPESQILPSLRGTSLDTEA